MPEQQPIRPDERPVRVLIVDDHEAVRTGAEHALRRAGMEVVGHAGEARAVAGLVERRRPDVVLVDIGLPDESGLVVAERLAGRPDAPAVLVYTGAEDPDTLREALRSGAAGLVSKTAPTAELAEAVRQAAATGTYINPVLGSLLAGREEGVQRVLTPREREVLALLARGMTGEQIAADLVLSPETVRTHVRNSMAKLAAQTRVHAVALALQRREISP